MADTREQLLNDKLNYLNQTKQLFRTVLESQGVEISDEDTFREYAYKIGDIDNGDVLLFSTKQAMNEYDNPKDGSLAIVYSDITDGLLSKYFNDISYVMFPEEVTLDVTCTEYKYHPIYTTYEQNVTFSNRIGEIYISPDSFYIQMINNNSKLVEYTSQDGKHYTRTTNLNNPYKFEVPISLTNQYLEFKWNYFSKFLLHDYGNFEGIFKCINGVFTPIYTQSNLIMPNQILKNINAYGSTENIAGDGSYISNIPMKDFLNKYFNPLSYDNSYFNLIQSGDKVHPMEFVEREQISINSAFEDTFPLKDCINQLETFINYHGPDYTQGDKLIIENYLNSSIKYNYSFYINNKAYRLYFGYNYITDEYNINGITRTMSKSITSVYGVIIDLSDLSVYKTISNTDTWNFTSKEYGSILNYRYIPDTNELLIITDLDGLGTVDGAYVGITSIDLTNNVRTTNYYTINISTEYEYKKVIYASYNKNTNCYYMAINSYNTQNSSIKQIIKIATNGVISTVLNSNDNLMYINYLWTPVLNDIEDLILYKTNNNTPVLHNLNNNNKIYIYGDDITGITFCAINDNYIYVSNKATESSSEYNIYKIYKDLTSSNVINNTSSVDRLYNFLFMYNNEICIFMDNKILSITGEFLNYFKPISTMVYTNTINGVFGLTKVNDYKYVASWSISEFANVEEYNVSGIAPKYEYYHYCKVNRFPIVNDLCLVGSINSTEPNNSSNVYFMADCVVITKSGSTITELSNEIIRLNSIINTSNTLADIIMG